MSSAGHLAHLDWIYKSCWCYYYKIGYSQYPQKQIVAGKDWLLHPADETNISCKCLILNRNQDLLFLLWWFLYHHGKYHCICSFSCNWPLGGCSSFLWCSSLWVFLGQNVSPKAGNILNHWDKILHQPFPQN